MKDIILIAFTTAAALADIVILISQCRILKKAGKKWWKGLIPVVYEYNLLSISWKKRWVPLYILAEVFQVFMVELVRVFINNWMLLMTSLMAPVFLYTVATALVLYFLFMITYCVNLSLHFGKSERFGIMTGVLPFIGFPILAFGKAEYSDTAEKWMFI